MSDRIISADCHIDMTWMPGDLWVKNGPAKFRDRVPQVRQTDDGPRWFAEEKELGVYGGLGFGFDRVQRGFSKHVERMFEVGFYEGGPHPTTPALRLKDQDIDGVDAEVMYGILGIGHMGSCSNEGGGCPLRAWRRRPSRARPGSSRTPGRIGPSRDFPRDIADSSCRGPEAIL